MNNLWDEELTEEETRRLVENLAKKIRKRKMETPAVLMLEMHKPLAFVGGQAMVAFSPFLIPFLGFDRVNDYSRLLSKRENWEMLLDAIERPDSENDPDPLEASA